MKPGSQQSERTEAMAASAAILSDLASPLGHIVHIGAGAGLDLPAYLAASPGAITLIEADPETVAGLKAVTVAQPKVKVIEAAVSGDTRKRVFRRTNFSELNSFRQPTGLKDLFPGLRTLSEKMVIPGDPVSLIQALDIPRDGPNLLVIKAPGEALGILRALEAADLLLNFDAICLREARAALYHEAPAAEEIRSFLTGVGYVAGFEAVSEDPERPYLTARLDRVALENVRRIAELTAALAEAQRNLSTTLLRAADLKDLQQRYASLLQGKEAQDELLQKLTASLSNAAQYLQDMDAGPAQETPAKTTRRRPPSGRAKTAGSPK